MNALNDIIKDDPALVSETARFTRMQDGTLEDWMKIGAAHKVDFTKTADRFIDMLKQLENATLGFNCDQLQHALMCATLARRDGATDEQIVVCLLYTSPSPRDLSTSRMPSSA